ncbi:MAG: hypothetical protein LBT60_02180 [Oscillospiraceae bacterium]|jgi:hypothetical protein|nr:hypothetical protein [Oscillospiraceae bacterium]
MHSRYPGTQEAFAPPLPPFVRQRTEPVFDAPGEEEAFSVRAEERQEHRGEGRRDGRRREERRAVQREEEHKTARHEEERRAEERRSARYEEERRGEEHREHRREERPGLFGGLLGPGIGRFLQNFRVDWDAGDILLILIMLFLLQEGDDEEILITLGLTLFMGL